MNDHFFKPVIDGIRGAKPCRSCDEYFVPDHDNWKTEMDCGELKHVDICDDCLKKGWPWK
jgi:hypothetical protein